LVKLVDVEKKEPALVLGIKDAMGRKGAICLFS
jgi:hypothetical protein